MPAYQHTNVHNPQLQSQESSSDTQTNSSQAQDRIGNSAVQQEIRSPHAPSGLSDSYREAFNNNQERTQEMEVGLSEEQMQTMSNFIKNWDTHQARYESVSQKSNMPATLIAAIHWRESTGNFNTYLHQGDPLGKQAVNWPTNIPIFTVWEDAAIHALQMKDSLQKQLEIDKATTDATLLATYAEAYNGLGYHYRDAPSPYVFAGTSAYSTGKFVSDGRFNKNVVDKQIGVMPLMGAIGGLNTEQDMTPKLISHETAWLKVVNGLKTLRSGDSGIEVEALQGKLAALGYEVGQDSDFGPGTKLKVVEFQRSKGLPADGIVGKGTATKIDEALGADSQ